MKLLSSVRQCFCFLHGFWGRGGGESGNIIWAALTCTQGNWVHSFLQSRKALCFLVQNDWLWKHPSWIWLGNVFGNLKHMDLKLTTVYGLTYCSIPKLRWDHSASHFSIQTWLFETPRLMTRYWDHSSWWPGTETTVRAILVYKHGFLKARLLVPRSS